ncbi:hypothetical protein ACFWIJ_06915 [Streptomyces sp. NPDC127079]|uniref:hypothetical protein n=1 Tax=Streptomyces sp. NPDC127079 TaxID=3347132 RepID=UPI0036495C87
MTSRQISVVSVADERLRTASIHTSVDYGSAMIRDTPVVTRPDRHPGGLDALVDLLVPELKRRGPIRIENEGRMLADIR